MPDRTDPIGRSQWTNSDTLCVCVCVKLATFFDSKCRKYTTHTGAHTHNLTISQWSGRIPMRVELWPRKQSARNVEGRVNVICYSMQPPAHPIPSGIAYIVTEIRRVIWYTVVGSSCDTVWHSQCIVMNSKHTHTHVHTLCRTVEIYLISGQLHHSSRSSMICM